MASPTDQDILGVGIYSLHEASRLVGVPSGSIRRWLQGYHYEYRGRRVEQPPVIPQRVALQGIDAVVVTFHDLLEVRFVHEFRKAGVSWKVIRNAAQRARDLLRTDHPFTAERFATDGRAIFAELTAEGYREKALLDLVKDQYVFRHVMLPSFRAQIDLTRTGAERWWPRGRNRGIVLDPTRQFGRPIVAEAGIPTTVLSSAMRVMRSAPQVAHWFDVPVGAVRQALAFEKQLAA